MINIYNPIIFNDEIFADINLPDIVPIYAISNYGTIINKNTNQQLSMTMTEDGYLRVGLRNIYGYSTHFLVHRLVMMIFHPIQNPEFYQVNHLYGIKIDNHDINLEWTTGVENINHAFETGLNNNIRESHSKAVISNDQAIKICECLSKGIPMKEIVGIIGETESNDIIRLIRSIYYRQAWNTISEEYEFPIYPNLRDSFNESEIHMVCKMIQDNKSYLDILVELGANPSMMTRKELENFCDVISNIRVGRYYKDISKNYNFTSVKKRHDQKFTDSQIIEICKLLESGYSNIQIMDNLGISKDSKNYIPCKKCISRIRNRKQFTDISKDYKF